MRFNCERWLVGALLLGRQRSRFIRTARTELKPNRFGAALSVLATGALILSGCSDNKASNTAEGSALPVPVNCGGTKTLKASGSTAEANAMTRFVKAYEQACPGQTLNYTPNGSGAGISEFTSNQTDFGGSDSPRSPTPRCSSGWAVRSAGADHRNHLRGIANGVREPWRGRVAVRSQRDRRPTEGDSAQQSYQSAHRLYGQAAPTRGQVKL